MYNKLITFTLFYTYTSSMYIDNVTVYQASIYNITTIDNTTNATTSDNTLIKDPNYVDASNLCDFMLALYIPGIIFGLCAIFCRCFNLDFYRPRQTHVPTTRPVARPVARPVTPSAPPAPSTPPVNRPLAAKYSYANDAPPPSYEVAMSEFYRNGPN